MNLGLCLPQFDLTVGMQSEEYESCIRSAVRAGIHGIALGVKDRAHRLYYQSEQYADDVNEDGIDLVASLRAQLEDAPRPLHTVVNIRCFDDLRVDEADSLVEWDPVQASTHARTDRVCPTSAHYASYLRRVALEAASHDVFAECHLSYMRYPHCFACVCERCLKAFLEHTGREFSPADLGSIFEDPTVFRLWVDWRSTVLAAFVGGFGRQFTSPDVRLSLEMDLSLRKGLLCGLKIDQGLDLTLLTDAVHALWLHIQPDTGVASTLDAVRASALVARCARYLGSNLHARGKEVVGFFWGIHSRSDLRSAIDVGNALGFDAIYVHPGVLHNLPRLVTALTHHIGGDH